MIALSRCVCGPCSQANYTSVWRLQVAFTFGVVWFFVWNICSFLRCFPFGTRHLFSTFSEFSSFLLNAGCRLRLEFFVHALFSNCSLFIYFICFRDELLQLWLSSVVTARVSRKDEMEWLCWTLLGAVTDCPALPLAATSVWPIVLSRREDRPALYW